MKVLVTGAAGFVGGAVVDALAQRGDEVRAMVRSDGTYSPPEGVELVLADLWDLGSLEAACEGVDVVIHPAALVREYGTRDEFWQTNVLGTKRLLEAARNAGARRFIFIGSPSALMSRDGGDQIEIDESVPYPQHFLNLYSETKAKSEEIVLAANSPEFETCSLRPRAIWGPGDRRGPVVQIAAKMRAGKLPDLSNGREVMASMCYIDHLVEAVLSATSAPDIAGKAYFLADAKPVNVWESFAEIAEVLGLEPPQRTIPNPVLSSAVAIIESIWKVPYIAHRYKPPLSRYTVALLSRTATYDTSAARRDLNFDPQIDADTGRQRFKQWIDDVGGLDVILKDA